MIANNAGSSMDVFAPMMHPTALEQAQPQDVW